jgi:ATP-binding cassette subfamily B protein
VRPDATDAECLEALERAACDGLLARADRKLDTVIGENKMKVSKNEKQRLSIARALLRQPHLLMFDEATSSLDSITEEEVTRTIREVVCDRRVMTVFIAYRFSTVMHADRIYVLERGCVVE